MKTRLICALLILALLPGLTLVAPVAASTLAVCPSGCTYTSIQAAIDAAAAGDTITVAAGNYEEQVTITKSLDLIGEGAATTIIKAPAVRSGAVTHAGTVHDYLLAAYAPSGAIDVHVQGFTLDLNGKNKTIGTAQMDGVFFRDVKDAGGTVAGLFSSTIHNFASSPDYEGFGIVVYGDSLLTLQGNDVHDYTRDGVSINRYGGAGSNPNVTISGNTITGSATPLNGINISSVTAGSVTGNIVTGNTKSDPWAAGGIVLWQSSGMQVTGNHVDGNYYGIDLQDNTSGVSVANNELTGNVKRGISLGAASNNTVSGNTITGPAGGTDDVGIGLSSGSTSNVIGGPNPADGNKVTLVTSGYWPAPAAPLLYAIWVDNTVGAGSNQIRHNTITGGRRSVQVDGGNTGTTTIADNLITNTPTGPEYPIYGISVNGGSANVTGNILNNAVRPVEFWGAANVNVDGNTIDGATYDGVNVGSASGTKTIRNNKIFNIPGANGIMVRGGNVGVVIQGNEIYNSYNGILTESNVRDTVITGNYIHNNSYGSINLNNASGTVATIVDNTIKNNERGIEANPGGGTIEAHLNNLVDNTYGGLFLYSSGVFNFQNNWWGASSGPNVDGSGPGTGAGIVTNGQTALTYAPWVKGLAATFSPAPGPFPDTGSPTVTPVATLFNSNGPLAAVGVSFYLDGVLKGTVATDNYGVATGPAITLPSAPGVHEISVVTLGGCLRTEGLYAIYDPTAGFVTGGGWINSPLGAFTKDATLTGKATFAFVSKYQKGATIPTGNTQFQFKAAELSFKSTAYEWLVIAGAKAQYKGVGTINGTGSYRFMLTAIDGQFNGSASPDKFRIKIWGDSGTVYDNQPGGNDTDEPTTTLGGGSIVVHK